MMTKEAIESLIQQEVAAKLTGNRFAAPQPTIELPAEAPIEEPPESVVKSLDEIDSIKLENLLLLQQVEKLRRQIEDRTINDVQTNLQAFLAKKYDVDTTKNQLVIDPKNLTLTITPRE